MVNLLSIGYGKVGILGNEDVLVQIVTHINSIEITTSLPLTNTGVVFSVIINNQIYTLAETNSPQVGEFTFNPSSQSLTINPIGLIPANTPISIEYQPLSQETVKTTQITKDIPTLFETWNIHGEITLNQTFESHPTATFKFLTDASNETSVRDTFDGAKFITLYGIGYKVSASQITHFPENKKIGVTVNLDGKWSPQQERSVLDRPIELKDFIGKTPTLNQLGAKVGASISGASITVPVPKNISKDATTTLRGELESRAVSVGGFVDYHSPTSPTVKSFGSTPLRYLSRADILQKSWSIAYTGQGATLNGVKLTHELNNVKLQIKKSSNNETGDEWITLVEGDPNPQIPPNIDKNLLRSNSLCFDLGGETKTKKTVTVVNSATVKEVIETYGFLYTEADTHVVSLKTVNGEETFEIRFADQSFNNYWTKIKHLEIIHTHNAQTGDYNSAIGGGWEMTRFLQPTSNLTICELQGAKLLSDDATEQAQLQKEIDLYQFFKNPIASATNFDLAKFSDFYDDVTTDNDESPSTFAQKTTQTEDSYATTPDPRLGDDGEARPPLVVGSRKSQQVIRTIASTQKELYKESETIFNAEGESFRNTAGVTTSRDISGRPPVQRRLTLTGKSVDKKEPETDTVTYRLNSQGSLSTLKTNQLFQLVSGITDLSTALTSAETYLAKENSRNACQLSLTMTRQPKWRVGDLVWCEEQKWLLLGINEQQIVRGRGVWYRPVSVQLGLLLRPNVSASVER